MRRVEEAQALAGRGLHGDRYADGAGTFSDFGGTGHDLTLVEAEALAALEVSPEDARRNVVTRGIALDGLIGRRFRIGEVECLGQRRCEPCAHLQRLGPPGILRGLVHRGGLRADLLTDGLLRPGSEIRPPPGPA
jgi:MOSC domain-containing protein YiiM